MEPLLYLVHRCPYPPDKGDKIRSYHLLRFLASRYRVYLGSFVDDPRDWVHRENLERYCAGVLLRPLRRSRVLLRCVAGFIAGKPLSVSYLADRVMQRWVEDVVRSENIGTAVVFSSGMAAYLQGKRFEQLRRFMDFVDLDSEKWRQYAKTAAWPVGYVYRREARLLLKHEYAVAAEYDHSFFVSVPESKLFSGYVGDLPGKISSFANGVDCAYFNPDRSYSNPYPRGTQAVVFTGAMDYAANVDAVRWFVDQIWPVIRKDADSPEFYIVGANPVREVLRLRRIEGVHVTGRVPDVRPFLAHSALAVAPMRVARGIQNKVLEAAAMAVPAVTTSAGVEGLEDLGKGSVRVADDPLGFARHCLALLSRPVRSEARSGASRRVCRCYDWDTSLREFGRHLEHAESELESSRAAAAAHGGR